MVSRLRRPILAGALGPGRLPEFAKDTPEQEQFADVDSGPLVFGYGIAASAFGVGATRAQGDLAKAAPLTAEMLATSCPLFDGSFLTPRLLSDAIDAPYLGESGILFCLTRPVPDDARPAGSVMTPFVWLVLLGYFGASLFLLLPMAVMVNERHKARRPADPTTAGKTGSELVPVNTKQVPIRAPTGLKTC